MDFVSILAKEFSLRPEQVQSVIALLDAGNTIPFIARYRKEATGSLDDQVLREVAERLEYLRGLEKRKQEIEKSLTEQGVLSQELAQKLTAAQTLSELEDLYRPFRPKRRTRATVARERGLEPLALWLLLQLPRGDAAAEAAKYVRPDQDVPDAEAALSFCTYGIVGLLLEYCEKKDVDRERLARQMYRLLTGRMAERRGA